VDLESHRKNMIMILMKLGTLALATVVMLALSACGSGTPIANTPASDAASNGSSGAAGPGTTKVSVAFYPLEYAATKVGGDKVSVTNLTLPGQEPHDLELTPQQVASLEEADLVVYLKGFQPAVDKAVEQSGAKNKLDLSQVIQLHPATEDHDHDHDAGETEDHDHGTTDPHFWLDPTLEAKAASAIADELSKIDANNKSTYETNAKSTTDDPTAPHGGPRAGGAPRRGETDHHHARRLRLPDRALRPGADRHQRALPQRAALPGPHREGPGGGQGTRRDHDLL